jgi:hypothetical protein
MSEKTVWLNGIFVPVSFAERFHAAQEVTHYKIGGRDYSRVHCSDRLCHDCAALKDQLHVPSCDMEQCPLCGGQTLARDCSYDGQSNIPYDFRLPDEIKAQLLG